MNIVWPCLSMVYNLFIYRHIVNMHYDKMNWLSKILKLEFMAS